MNIPTNTVVTSPAFLRMKHIDVFIPEGHVALTPDALLSYCSAQLRNIDSQVKEQMDEQEKLRGSMGNLNELRRLFANNQGQDMNDAAFKKAALEAFVATINAMPAGAARTAVQAQFEAFRKDACCGDTTDGKVVGEYTQAKLDEDSKKTSEGDMVTAAGMKQFADNIGSIVEDMNKGAELQMIGLQSLISQRQMAVQLTTNLIQKLNESLMAPIANLK